MAHQFADEIDAVEKQLGLPSGLLKAVAYSENVSGDPNVVSKAAFPGSKGGAVGVLQLMPSTFSALKLQGKLPEDAKITDPIANILAGGHVLKEGLQAAGGDIRKAIAYYNTNPKRALSGNWLPETQAYVPKVLKTYQSLSGDTSDTSFSAGVRGDNMPGTMSGAQGFQANPDTTSAINAATSQLFSSISAQDALRAKTGTELLNSLEMIKSAGANSAQAAQEEASARAGQVLIAGQRAAGFEQAASAIMSSLGMSPEQTDNFRGTSLAKITDLSTQRSQLRQDITAKQSVGIFDNPVQWFMNQLSLPGEIAQHNGLLQTQMGLESDLQRNLAMTGTELGHAAAIANQKTASELTQQAMAEVAAGKQRVEALQAATAGNAAATALQMQSLQNQAVQDDKLRLGIHTDEQGRERQDQAFKNTIENQLRDDALRKKQFNLMEAEHKEAGTLKAEKRAEYEKTQATLQTVNDMLGRADTQATISLMPTKQKAKYMEAWPVTGTFGNTVPEAIIFTTNFANIPIMSRTNQAQAEFISSLKKSIGDKLSVLTPAQKLGKKPEDLEFVAAQELGQSLLDGAKNTSIGVLSGKGNPYRATYSVLSDPAKTPVLADNMVAKMVQAAKSATGSFDQVSDGMLLSAITAKIEDGSVPLEFAAKQISEFYQVAAITNNRAYKFEIFNLPKQTNYLAPIQDLYGTKVIDFANEQVVKNSLLRAIVAQRTRDLVQWTGGVGSLPGALVKGAGILQDKLFNSGAE